ncbi:MAG: WD40 repeat domain-containing protein [Salibacteraceae bacterium]
MNSFLMKPIIPCLLLFFFGSIGYGQEELVITASRWCNPLFDEFADFSFSPDGKYVAFGQEDGKVRVVDIEAKSEVFGQVVHKKQSVTVRFSPDGKHMVSCGKDGRLYVFDVEKDFRQVKSLQVSEKAIRAIEFSPEGDRLYAGGNDEILWVLDFPALEITESFNLRKGNIHSIVLQLDKDLIWVGTSRVLGGLIVVDAKSGTVKRDFMATNVIDLDLSSDGMYVLAVSFDRVLFRVNTTSFSMDTRKKFHSKATNNLRVLPNTAIFATTSNDKTVRFSNVNTLEQQHSIPLPKGVMNLGFSSNQQWMAIALSNGYILIYNIAELPFNKKD